LTPAMSLISLATIPFAFKAMNKTMKYYNNLQEIIPAMKMNVITVLGTDALLALSYFLA
jgi:hypothetical protein